jgi:hypothetical protein
MKGAQQETDLGGRPPAASSNRPGGGSSGSGSTSGKRFLWTLEFYAQFFDVDTNEVIKRCWAALFPRANFLDVLEGNPDLYGKEDATVANV